MKVIGLKKYLFLFCPSKFGIIKLVTFIFYINISMMAHDHCPGGQVVRA